MVKRFSSNCADKNANYNFRCVKERRFFLLTFIMRTTVLIAIIVRMEYSNGDETTNFHILYWKDCLSWGM